MIIFATIFGVGFLVLILSLIFGSDTDVDTDVVDADAAHGGPSIFSMKMISLLMVGFGATGFGFRASTEFSMFQSSMAGIGGAAVIGIIGYIIIRAFYASQESSTITDQDIVGQTAHVIDAISGKNNGQISCIIRGREITFLARTDDNKSIQKGSPVKIISINGNIVTVEQL